MKSFNRLLSLGLFIFGSAFTAHAQREAGESECWPANATPTYLWTGCYPVNLPIVQAAVNQFDPNLIYSNASASTSVVSSGNIAASVQVYCLSGAIPAQSGQTIRTQAAAFLAQCGTLCGAYFTSDSCDIVFTTTEYTPPNTPPPGRIPQGTRPAA